MKTYYRRNLPHWQPEGRKLFITFRLFGSLPDAVIKRLKEEQELLRKNPPIYNESPKERVLREGKRLFGLLDEALAQELNNSNSHTPK